MEGEETVKASNERTLSSIVVATMIFGPFVFWAYFVRTVVSKAWPSNIPGVHVAYLIPIWCALILAAIAIIVILSFKYYLPELEKIQATKKKAVKK